MIAKVRGTMMQTDSSIKLMSSRHLLSNFLLLLFHPVVLDAALVVVVGAVVR